MINMEHIENFLSIINKNCDNNELIKLLNYFPDKPRNWHFIGSNPNITWEIITNNPNIPWDWYEIGNNPNITWEIITDNPDKRWDWYYISRNPNITWEIIRDNPDMPWEWIWLSFNKFKQDPILKQRQLKLLQLQAKLRRTLIHYPLESEYFLIPPDYSDKPVFKKGGPWFWEGAIIFIQELRRK